MESRGIMQGGEPHKPALSEVSTKYNGCNPMVYVDLMTGAGHLLTVNPKKQKALFLSLIEAQLAESRFVFKERQIDYGKYRAKRRRLKGPESSVSITRTVHAQFDKLDDATFGRLDRGITELFRRPDKASSKPKHYRWFLGDLRRVKIDEFPIIYVTVKDDPKLRILYVGFRNWRKSITNSPKCLGGNGSRLPSQVGRAEPRTANRKEEQSITDRFIEYSGETTAELLAYPAAGQYDALVQAFREGIQQKAEREGNRSLSRKEWVVLAVTALEEEVNNGGYDQFLRNHSRKFAPIVVDALERIGCRREAGITRKALQTLHTRKLDLKSVDTTMEKDSPERDEALERCDQMFYRRQRGMAKRLYAFIKANRRQITIGPKVKKS